MRVLDSGAVGYWLTDWCKEANLQPSKVQYKIDRENLKIKYLHSKSWLLDRP